MGEIVDADEVATWAVWVSPVFGDIVAKMTVGVKLEVERRLRLGLPVVVDRGNGIEDLPPDQLAEAPARTARVRSRSQPSSSMTRRALPSSPRNGHLS
jgi:hypothetical protein